MSESVLVVGATGGVGKQVVLKLLATDTPVRVLVRDFKAARRLLTDEVEYIAGDVREPETLKPAFDNASAVICAIGTEGDKDSTNTPETVDYVGVRNLVEAARQTNVDHFVLISWLGVTHPNSAEDASLRDVLAWKQKGEEAVQASGLTYTIIRPGLLTDDLGGQQALRLNQGDPPDFTGYISREDVAELAVQALYTPSARKVTFEVVAESGKPLTDWYILFGGLKPDR